MTGILRTGIALLALAVTFATSPPSAAQSDSAAVRSIDTIYTLGSGDRLRVTVFDEPDLSGQFEIDGSGSVSIPLIGNVVVAGKTLREAERLIESHFLDGYLKQPRVSIDVLNYRPFYILGEVKNPGSYPYVNGMTVLNAVALAGGFTYRARESRLQIIRASDPSRTEADIEPDSLVLPGDIIRIPERFF